MRSTEDEQPHEDAANQMRQSGRGKGVNWMNCGNIQLLLS